MFYKLLFILFLKTICSFAAQGQQKGGKAIVHIVDSMQLSPSFQLSFYWWDPYHIYQGKKELSPINIDEKSFSNQAPPYTYDFKLKKGLIEFYILSCFNDTVFFNFALQNDTTIDFQQKVSQFYTLIDSNTQLLHLPKHAGDLYTLYIAKLFNDNIEGLRLDLTVDSLANWQLAAVNRQVPTAQEKEQINCTRLNELLLAVEPAAKELSSPDEHGYIVTIRRNRQVIEYKGKSGGGNINNILGKLKRLCLPNKK